MNSKKSFRDVENPAELFISKPTPVADQVQPITVDRRQSAPDGFKLNPVYVEKMTKRFQLVMTPTLFDAIKDKSLEKGISANELIRSILERELFGD